MGGLKNGHYWRVALRRQLALVCIALVPRKKWN